MSKGLVIFGCAEIVIGLATFVSVSASLILGTSGKPLEVLVFVLTSSLISFGLGIGILRRSPQAYHLLIFFSCAIILSKILIFFRIIALNGALETSIPPGVKGAVSVLYHSLLVAYFIRPAARKEFGLRDEKA